MKRETRIGLMVVSGFLAIYLFVSWTKSIHLFSVSRKTWEISFENVNGLKEGDPVSVKGYPVGNVISIQFSEGKLISKISLDPSVIVFEDATAEIQVKELMGGKMVALNPGKSPNSLPNGKRITGYSGADFSTAFSTFGNLANSLNPQSMDSLAAHFTQIAKAFADVSKNFEGDRMNRFFDASLGSMEKLNANLNQLDNSHLFQRIDSAFSKFNRLANTSEKLMVKVDENMSDFRKSYEGKLDSTLSTLGKTLQETREVMVDVKSILSSAQNKQSLSGKMLNDPAFAQEMETALKNLNKTLEIINSDRLKIGLNLKNKR